MVFRSDGEASVALARPVDPLDRFLELRAALDLVGGIFRDRNAPRLAASVLLDVEGAPREIAAEIDRRQAVLGKELGFFSMVAAPLRFVLAGVLYRRGVEPREFARAFLVARREFRRQRVRRSEVHELLAFTLLSGRWGIDAELEEPVARMQAIFRGLRRRHFWITGSSDLAACASLSRRLGDADAIAAEVDACYRQLRRHLRWWRGQSLHRAAQILALSGVEPETAAQRAEAVRAALRRQGYKVGVGDYTNVALLCFLAVPVEKLVGRVNLFAAKIQRTQGIFFGQHAAFNLGVNLAFTQMLQGNTDLAHLAEVKALLDMNAILEAQSAGAAAT